jgi:NADH:ubiquinone oxidoreductase subunit 6 (subunit J)
MAGSGWETLAFYLVAALAAGSALGCIIATNIVRMALCLLGTLGAVALLYFLLAANFLGVIQLVVYAGGTLIVIVFGVMLTSRTYGIKLRPTRIEAVVGLVVCAALLAGLVGILATTNWHTAGATAVASGQAPNDVAAFGKQLLGPYLVPFELVSVLLLAVMIGAAYLAQPGKRTSEE